MSHRAGRTVAASSPSDSVWRLCKVLDLRTNRGAEGQLERRTDSVFFRKTNKKEKPINKCVCIYNQKAAVVSR